MTAQDILDQISAHSDITVGRPPTQFQQTLALIDEGIVQRLEG